jgi:hypothetical protein
LVQGLCVGDSFHDKVTLFASVKRLVTTDFESPELRSFAFPRLLEGGKSLGPVDLFGFLALALAAAVGGCGGDIHPSFGKTAGLLPKVFNAPVRQPVDLAVGGVRIRKVLHVHARIHLDLSAKAKDKKWNDVWVVKI